jgi:hypothetical protein
LLKHYPLIFLFRQFKIQSKCLLGLETGDCTQGPMFVMPFTQWKDHVFMAMMKGRYSLSQLWLTKVRFRKCISWKKKLFLSSSLSFSIALRWSQDLRAHFLLRDIIMTSTFTRQKLHRRSLDEPACWWPWETFESFLEAITESTWSIDCLQRRIRYKTKADFV